MRGFLVEKTMERLNISVLTANGRRRPDLSDLCRQIEEHPDLLNVPLERLEESFDRKLAAVIVAYRDGREIPVAFSRLIPLLSDEISDALRLPEELRKIYELGSVFVSEDWRNQHLGSEVQKATLGVTSAAFKDRSQLVIGTTKDIREIKAVSHITGLEGVQFEAAHHLDYSHIAPLTCVCKPEEPPFGTGFQFGESCSQRIQRTDVPQIIFRSGIPRRQDVVQDTHIPCTMFVSSRKTAELFNAGFVRFFGSRENMVRRLKEVGYYE